MMSPFVYGSVDAGELSVVGGLGGISSPLATGRSCDIADCRRHGAMFLNERRKIFPLLFTLTS